MNRDYLSPDDVKKPVKVRVGYRDGYHWLEAYTDDMAKVGLAYVEVDQHTWAQWQAHRAAARAWDSFCLALDGEQYAKDHPTVAEVIADLNDDERDDE